MNKRRVVVVAAMLLALSAVVGGLWVLLAPTPAIVVEEPGSGQYATEADPAKLFSAVAVFAFLAFGLGAVISLASWFGMRSTRGAGALLFVTAMAVATSALAIKIGSWGGHALRGEIDTSVPGTYRGTVNLWIVSEVGPSWILLICAPTAAVLVYLVCVISSNHADLGRGDDVPALVGVGAEGPYDAFAPIDSPASAEPITSEGEAPRTRP